ncbi:glycoside hydrolase family 3 C-terminal domain-containing protein [Acholeplasma vituli]|uniref:beta-glucosidase n=1 Tax=Paracholeplasma vituli TaxID=69473 RepID=A0ABT2PW47_9MOLU|nr:glycoside hydrolase family 3 N-terminal domain-containing protein [Paracholeplasma vituli]MCU0105186.1 glycoside hydrolase family 3 C-terminal domain-containing protein [Paracholeplasma vituli]
MLNIKTLLNSLSIEEKIGQLMQLAPFFFIGDLKKEVYGPIQALGLKEEEVFLSGSVLGIGNASEMRRVQEAYLAKSRHKIPLIFMADIIHGYKTIFPVPLAMSTSFNPDLIKKAARISALEAQTAGIHVTFSPMADLSRDPRWGRVVEGFGEDPYLNQVYAKAMVEGYQHDGIEKVGNLASCVKHFAAYGASEAGRDYNTVDISRLNLHQYYLSGYKAAIDAGARLVMTSFNIIEGIPATQNKYLLRELLKVQWQFDGVVISDYDSLRQTIEHGTSEDDYDAAKKAILAGLDIEMATSSYVLNLKKLIENNEVPMSLLDDAVYRVLKLKNDLGLFDNPFKGADEQKEREFVLSKENKKVALEVAKESMVLLKNDSVLPLKYTQKIALLGEYSKNPHTIGPWSWHGRSEDCTPLYQAISKYTKPLLVSDSNDLSTLSPSDYQALVESDVVVVAIGEHAIESGEAHSKTNLTLKPNDLRLIEDLSKLGKKIVLVLYHGRPVVLTDVEPKVHAILDTFFLGTMAQEAITETLFGFNNPSGKLTMSYPRSVGQIPIYYNYLNTGRPFKNDGNPFTSFYLDEKNTPLYPFGYGLSYSSFKLSNYRLSKQIIRESEPILVSIDVENASPIDGYETVQLYIRDYAAEVARPVQELKQFKKVFVKAKSKQTVTFELTVSDLVYVHSDLSTYADHGRFSIQVGNTSNQVHTTDITFL